MEILYLVDSIWHYHAELLKTIPCQIRMLYKIQSILVFTTYITHVLLLFSSWIYCKSLHSTMCCPPFPANPLQLSESTGPECACLSIALVPMFTPQLSHYLALATSAVSIFTPETYVSHHLLTNCQILCTFTQKLLTCCSWLVGLQLRIAAHWLRINLIRPITAHCHFRVWAAHYGSHLLVQPSW